LITQVIRSITENYHQLQIRVIQIQHWLTDISETKQWMGWTMVSRRL